MPAYFRRADIVALPYREIEQSGVLYTALAFGSPLVLSAVGGFPEIAEQRRGSAGPSRATRSRCGRALSSCSTTSGPAPDFAGGRALARRGPFLGARRASPPSDLYRTPAGGAARMTVVEIVFWVSVGPDRLHARRLSAAAACARARCGRARAGRTSPRPAAAVSLIVAAHDEDDVIEQKVANALALDYPPERWS